MNRTKIVIILVLLLTIILTGCSKDSNEKEIISSEISNKDTIEKATTKDKEIDVIVSDISGKIKSPLTGLYIDENQLNDRFIAVMFDNHNQARPQAGISQCDIVYEMLVEGSITRYMGILGSEKPSNIGPIRSARHYFIERSLEYDGLYVHGGGSPQADQAIADLAIPSVSSMHLGQDIFGRQNHKYAPHNMYSSFEALVKGGSRKNYRSQGKYEGLSFSDTEKKLEGNTVSSIEFPYNGKNYYSSYLYNKEEKVFYRYVKGKPHLDENDNVPIVAKNIIVQFTSTNLIPGDTEGRLHLDMVGEGKGLYLSNGKYQEVTWKKSSKKALTKYYNLLGKEIEFNPGNFWIQVYPKNRSEEIKIEN